MKNLFIKILVIIFVIVYAVSPIDLAPGPLDDIIIAIMSYITTKKLLVVER